MALTSTDKQVSSLIINKVPSEDVYQQMIAQNLVNDNEIYIVQDNDKTTIEPATAKPKENGNATAGTSLKYAREDHVHPMQSVGVTSVNGAIGDIIITSGEGKIDQEGGGTTGPLTFYGDNGITAYGAIGYHSNNIELLSDLDLTIYSPNSSIKLFTQSANKAINIGYSTTAGPVIIQGSSVKINGKDPIKSMRKLTLSAANWSTSAKTYTATVNGILADATKQAIDINPIAKADNDNAVKFGVYPTAQGANSITFLCDTIPTTAINFYVTYQDVNYLQDGPSEPSKD